MRTPEATSPLPREALLRADKLTIRFGGLVAVNAVDLEIRQGELLGLIGPNGAGKTTCFNLLTGVYAPTSGSIKLDGSDIQGLPPHKVAALGLGRTFQNIRLFKELTVLENVLVACHHQRGYGFLSALLRLPSFRRGEAALREKAMGLLKALDLDAKADVRAKSLPYGEQRKAEIARALAADPKILLLDEPAAGMNPVETARLCELILNIRRQFGVTILLIEHDMSLVMKICERIAVLDYGNLIAQGTPEEIRSNPKVIEAYLGGGLDRDLKNEIAPEATT
jgi:branched-chain amino acid transport system ATP-binding protein